MVDETLTIAAINELGEAAFLDRFGGIAEHSPWVAATAFDAYPFASRMVMVDAFQRAVGNATRAKQEALLRAHPDLAGKLAAAGTLEPDSRREQAGAGLDTLDAGELARFHDLNDRYVARFGFPFILAVKGATKHQILDAFSSRIAGGHEEEFLTALAQVMRIIRFRLEDRVDA